MMDTFNIFFDDPKPFELQNLKSLSGLVGLYFIFSPDINIQYPYRSSNLIYIGMSEKKTNSMGSRLTGHFEGKSKNAGLYNYKKVSKLLFTFINFEMLKNFWNYRIEDLESYFLIDFVDKYGVYPICNNKASYSIQSKSLKTNFIIDWTYFENYIQNGKQKS